MVFTVFLPIELTNELLARNTIRRSEMQKKLFAASLTSIILSTVMMTGCSTLQQTDADTSKTATTAPAPADTAAKPATTTPAAKPAAAKPAAAKPAAAKPATAAAATKSAVAAAKTAAAATESAVVAAKTAAVKAIEEKTSK